MTIAAIAAVLANTLVFGNHAKNSHASLSKQANISGEHRLKNYCHNS